MVADSSVANATCTLLDFRVCNFRCLESAEFRFDPKVNVFTGANGAGKTSILESIYFLGRGRSFRASDKRLLIRSGYDAAELAGAGLSQSGATQLKVRIEPTSLKIQVGNQPAAGIADLAMGLPVQAIHSDIGGVIEGPPDVRRRLLDWGVFHVEHHYFGHWQRYRRALVQRNAALREAASDAVLDSWDQEVASAGERMHADRREYLDELAPAFRRVGKSILGVDIGLQYQRGWPDQAALVDALRSAREADRSVGYTRVGPHRGDLQFDIESERSRWRASRGQQKLLGAALVLAQCDQVANALGQPVALLVDEPAADLDDEHLSRFLQAVWSSPAQVFMAALSVAGLPLEGSAAMFHVEHGRSKALL